MATTTTVASPMGITSWRLWVMSNPRRRVSRSGMPDTWGTSQGCRNSQRLAAKAKASVMMARARPLIRNAGRPMARLATTAPSHAEDDGQRAAGHRSRRWPGR